jgi:hypothetical protein
MPIGCYGLSSVRPSRAGVKSCSWSSPKPCSNGITWAFAWSGAGNPDPNTAVLRSIVNSSPSSAGCGKPIQPGVVAASKPNWLSSTSAFPIQPFANIGRSQGVVPQPGALSSGPISKTRSPSTSSSSQRFPVGCCSCSWSWPTLAQGPAL